MIRSTVPLAKQLLLLAGAYQLEYQRPSSVSALLLGILIAELIDGISVWSTDLVCTKPLASKNKQETRKEEMSLMRFI